MRVSLIQPPQGSRFGFTKVLRVEPLGLECVGASLRRHDHEVKLLDLRLDDTRALRSHLRSWRPQGVGISCGFTSDVYTTLHTARLVHEALPNAVIFVGGHHASLIPGDFLFPGSPVEAVVVGEGEATGLELVDALERGDDPSGVPGVMTLSNRATGFEPRTKLEPLDSRPLPARDLTRRYRSRYHHGFSAPSACVETSRGCPFDCNFCSIWVFYERRVRRTSVDRVVEDLLQIKRLGQKYVFFTDDIAFLDRDFYEELVQRVCREGLQMNYICETRADLVVKYKELFAEWQKVGMDTIFLGIEKIDDASLDAVRKRTKGGASTNLEAIEILRGCGIVPMTSLIVDPSWGEEDFNRLEAFVKAARLPNPTFTILTPLPGTELWESHKSKLVTNDYSYFDVIHLVLPSRLTPERFYERFASLYRLADVRTYVSAPALIEVAKRTLAGQAWVAGRVLSAVRDMQSPKGYLAYPGSIPRPEFVPREIGTAAWVDEARSHMPRRLKVVQAS
jgi:hopanoid C-3 methylase